jgi:glucose/arabinose dehydrogenase
VVLLTFPAAARAAIQQSPSIVLQTILSGLDQPVFVGHAGDGSNRLFIVEQPGRIRMRQPGSSQTTLFLDISSRVVCCGEQGLLGLAFHPKFASNRRFFVNYTRAGDGATVIAEYQVSEEHSDIANITERIILTIAHPFANHNGGMLAFGPDGYLYIGTGDGGSGNDPDNRAQNINDLLGKILRLDIDQIPYGSPSTNPFFGATPGRDEIYAVGLRNPWRFSFDRVTGNLYVGDVGQNAREEVNLVTLGGNYGWRVFEGTLCTNLGPAPCSDAGFIAPIAEYAHTQPATRCSVTGGYSYRGALETLPQGAYFYGDFCTGEIFRFLNGVAEMILDTSLQISSFGEDESGEHYVVSLSGTVSRITTPLQIPTLASITPSTALPGTSLAVTLTGTGFVTGLSINAGSGVTAGNIQVVNSTSATATLTIAGNATFGARSLSVATPAGVSGPVSFIIVPPPPIVDNTTIGSGAPGTTVNVTLTGTNFVAPAIAVDGGDVTVSNVNAISSTLITAAFTVPATASPGIRSVTVTTAGGTGYASFLVGNPIPVITTVTPSVGVRGTSVDVTLQGSGFVIAGTSMEGIPGIVIRDLIVQSFTRMTATFDISADADMGARSIRVATAGGTSEGIEFVIAIPFPDLEIVGSHSSTFGAGFDEAYSITVRNAGGVSTSGAINFVDVLPNGLSFVSANGSGWSCGAAGSTVSCAHASILEPGSSTTITLTVAVDSSAAPAVTHTVMASTTGDLNSANNTHADITAVLMPPTPVLAVTPSSPLPAGKQAALTLTIPTPFPHDITGTLDLSFSPDSNVDDPSIQFETGGRSVAFTIPANTANARFTGAGTEDSIRFQSGTVAGAFEFTGTSRAGRLENVFTPSGASTLTIPPQPPVIHDLRTSGEGGFAALITSFSTTREIQQVVLEFNTTERVALRCGSAPGCIASGNRMTLDVASLFNSWFGGNTSLGGLTTLRLPFSVAGVVHGTVGVTLVNSRGLSNTVSFALP